MLPAEAFEKRTPFNRFAGKADVEHWMNFENLRAVYLWRHILLIISKKCADIRDTPIKVLDYIFNKSFSYYQYVIVALDVLTNTQVRICM